MMFDPTCPFLLPLLPPQLNIGDDKDLNDLLKTTRIKLAELNGYIQAIPNPMLIASPATIKEAIASSKISAIHTTLIDVLESQALLEAERISKEKEVLRYREALEAGLEDLPKYSLTTRTISSIQKKLELSFTGEYRQQQNSVKDFIKDEIVYTPPEASKVNSLMQNWENFSNNGEPDIDLLIKAIISHYQFVAIHPFSNGNGRTGRVLMLLQLSQYKLLTYPIIYISGYIEKNKSKYNELLLSVSKEGNWKGYIAFMLHGFLEQTAKTYLLLEETMKHFYELKKKLKEQDFGISASELAEAMVSYPVTNQSFLSRHLNIHRSTAGDYLRKLETLGFLESKKSGKYINYTNTKLIRLIEALDNR